MQPLSVRISINCPPFHWKVKMEFFMKMQGEHVGSQWNLGGYS